MIRSIIIRLGTFASKRKVQEIVSIIGLTFISISIINCLVFGYKLLYLKDNAFEDKFIYSLILIAGMFMGAMICKYFLYGFGYVKEENNQINKFPIDNSTLGKREQQHQIILAVIDSLQFNPLEIPTGGKSKIRGICLNRPRVFTVSAFDHAWKDGINQGLFRMLESEKFSSK